MKNVHTNSPGPGINEDGIPSRDTTLAHGLSEHRHLGGALVAWRSPLRVVGDSVLYHSLLGLARPREISRAWTVMALFAWVEGRCEIGPMALLGPSPFIATNTGHYFHIASLQRNHAARISLPRRAADEGPGSGDQSLGAWTANMPSIGCFPWWSARSKRLPSRLAGRRAITIRW
jgi:hypothetical protein